MPDMEARNIRQLLDVSVGSRFVTTDDVAWLEAVALPLSTDDLARVCQIRAAFCVRPHKLAALP